MIDRTDRTSDRPSESGEFRNVLEATVTDAYRAAAGKPLSLAQLRAATERVLFKRESDDGAVVVIAASDLNVTIRRMEKVIAILEGVSDVADAMAREGYAKRVAVLTDQMRISAMLLGTSTPHFCADCGKSFDQITDATFRYVENDRELVHSYGRGCKAPLTVQESLARGDGEVMEAIA